jgi:phospholipase A1
MLLFLMFQMFQVFAAPSETTPSDPANGPEDKNAVDITEFKREEESILQRHQPFYFAYGNPSSKLQLSFKAPIVKDAPLYFAYTQQMFWNLRETSKPFQDSTYNPDLIYRWNTDYGVLSSIDFAPWSHTSNGKKDKDSRSYNKHYIKFNLDHERTSWIFRGGVQLSYLYDYEDTNINIQDYIGPLGISFSAIQLFNGWVDKSEFGVLITPGGKYADDWGRGGYQFSWSFRLGGLELMPAFYLQYYVGYAETLLNYDQRVNEFRAGFIL